MKKMKAFRVDDIKQASVQEVAIPTPVKDEVLIRVEAAGLCGTDIKIFLGEFDAIFPVTLGHEFSGQVVEVGPDVNDFEPGNRVAADPNVYCEKCHFCKQNMQNQCRYAKGMGGTMDGSFAQYIIAPEACVVDIADTAYEAAALAEPLACVVYGQQRVRPKLGDHVLIFGAGAIGLLHLQLAKHNGAAFVTVVDIKKDRLDLAKEMGADHVFVSSDELKDRLFEIEPLGFDVVIDSTGVTAVVEDCVQYLSDAGSLLVFGVCHPDDTIRISPYDIYKHDLNIVGSFSLKKTLPAAVKLLQSGAVQVDKLIGERITLEQMPDAIERFIAGETYMRVIVQPNA